MSTELSAIGPSADVQFGAVIERFQHPLRYTFGLFISTTSVEQRNCEVRQLYAQLSQTPRPLSELERVIAEWHFLQPMTLSIPLFGETGLAIKPFWRKHKRAPDLPYGHLPDWPRGDW